MNGFVFAVFGIVAVLIIIMAVLLFNGKGAFLIAGYNTMSKDKKAKYDKKSLCRFVGWLLIVVSFSMMLIPIGDYLEIRWLTYCGIALILISVIGAVFYANTGNRFRKENSSEVSVIDKN